MKKQTIYIYNYRASEPVKTLKLSSTKDSEKLEKLALGLYEKLGNFVARDEYLQSRFAVQNGQYIYGN